MTRYIHSILCVTAIGLCACQPVSKVDQSDMCVYETDVDAKECESGHLAYFKPNSWGSEQLPLAVAAAYCDFNYPVMHTNAGVICVFTKDRLHMMSE